MGPLMRPPLTWVLTIHVYHNHKHYIRTGCQINVGCHFFGQIEFNLAAPVSGLKHSVYPSHPCFVSSKAKEKLCPLFFCLTFYLLP